MLGIPPNLVTTVMVREWLSLADMSSTITASAATTPSQSSRSSHLHTLLWQLMMIEPMTLLSYYSNTQPSIVAQWALSAYHSHMMSFQTWLLLLLGGAELTKLQWMHNSHLSWGWYNSQSVLRSIDTPRCLEQYCPRRNISIRTHAQEIQVISLKHQTSWGWAVVCMLLSLP